MALQEIDEWVTLSVLILNEEDAHLTFSLLYIIVGAQATAK